MSSEKATTAWRPKVSTSRRKVVTWNGRPAATTVMVPWSMPVGTGLRPAAFASATTASGRASVARSMSATGQPRRALRTQPPTKRMAWPPASIAAQTARVGAAPTQGASMRIGGMVTPTVLLPVQSGSLSRRSDSRAINGGISTLTVSQTSSKFVSK